MAKKLCRAKHPTNAKAVCKLPDDGHDQHEAKVGKQTIIWTAQAERDDLPKRKR